MLNKFVKWFTKYPDPKTRFDFDPNDIQLNENSEIPYIVKIYNDDVTTIEYVFHLLHTYFLMDTKEAGECVMRIHEEGEATVFRSDKKSAEWLVRCINKENDKSGNSLKCEAVSESHI